MTQSTAWTAFQHALGRHLSPIKGLLACHAIARMADGQWQEIGRIGAVDPALAEQVLAGFAPGAGGTVQPLAAGGAAAWLASYGCGGPGLDLCLLFYLAEMGPADLQQRLTLLEDKAGWLLVAALTERAQRQDDFALSVEIGAAVLLEAATAPNRAVLADQWIARLEKALLPDALALCWVRNDEPALAALSGGALVEHPSRARSAVERLARAAILARSASFFDTAAAETPADTAEALAELAGLGIAQAMALPVYEGDPCRAVVVVLWAGAEARLPDRAAADMIGQVLGEALAIQAHANPSLLRRLSRWAGGALRALFGQRGLKLKVLAAAVALVLTAAALIPHVERPAFNARIEARDRMVVAAPFDGFVAEAPFQLGDSVAKGVLLLAMEDADFRLDLARSQAELARLENESQAARAQRDTARVRSLEAQAQQARVDIDLLTDQIARARLVARQPGIVVAGDAWRRVGGRVRLGEPLMELVDPGSFAVLAFIDEDWVAGIPPGAQASILLAAFPDTPIPVTLQSITTDARNIDGVNSFPAWLSFRAPPGVTVLDGMRGIVRIEAGQSSVLRSYGRGILRWAQRALWRWS